MSATNSTGPAINVNDAGLIMIIGYVPSLDAASTMTAFYCIILVISLYIANLVRLRGAGGPTMCCCLHVCFGNAKICHYSSVLWISAVIELIGYAARRDMIMKFGAWDYLFSTISLLIAPVILAIMNYKAITHMLGAADTKIAYLSPTTISTIIIYIDVACAILQFGGSVCATLALAMGLQLIRTVSNYLIVCSFVLQILLGIFFTALCRYMYLQPYFSPSHSSIPNIVNFWRTLWTTVTLLGFGISTALSMPSSW